MPSKGHKLGHKWGHISVEKLKIEANTLFLKLECAININLKHSIEHEWRFENFLKRQKTKLCAICGGNVETLGSSLGQVT